MNGVKPLCIAAACSAALCRWQDALTVLDGDFEAEALKPRDVLRLANAVKFSWPTLEGEIDPVDLLAMEGLRLFDTQAFNWIRDNRDFLFRDGHYQQRAAAPR
jgi:hypothetical protein